MSASGKYRIMEAETPDERKSYRLLIEETLAKSNLSLEQRAELEQKLNLILFKEKQEQDAEEDRLREEEEERKKKEGEGGDGEGEQGSAGGSSDGGSGGGDSGDAGQGGGGDSGGDAGEGSGGDGGIAPDMQLFELLVYMDEMDKEQQQEFASPDSAYTVEEPLAAATLLYDQEENIAKIHEPYTVEHESSRHSPSAFLPSLEQHAASLGARELRVMVHQDAVDIFKRKFGYEPYEKAGAKNDPSLQRMRKVLVHSPALGVSTPV